MWINDVTLDDFGCFDRARLDGLQDGVNVIVGPQRAGKTTFMEAVRHLGYGIPRDGSVPPATDGYSLGATVTTADGQSRIDLEGYAKPSVTAIRGADRTIEELYGNLRKEQYHQLYTISLDELRRSPRSLDSDVSLAEVLLGGGFGDAVKLPRYRDEFGETARSIGGKHGRASYELKGPLRTIEEGVEDRDAATDQVDEYDRVASKVESLGESLESIATQRSALEEEQTLLETVRANHEEYTRYRRLQTELADVDESRLEGFPLDRVGDVRSLVDEYREARVELDERLREFERVTTVDDTEAALSRLQGRYDDVRDRLAELSGMRERHARVVEEAAEIQSTWQSIRDRAADLDADWGSDLDAVRAIETDAVARDEVDRITSAYADAVEDRDRQASALEAARDRRSALEAQLEDARGDAVPDGSVPLATIAGGSVIALLLGIGASVAVTSIAGVVVTFLVLIATGAVAYRDVEGTNEEASAVQTLNADLRGASASVDEKAEALERAEAALADAETEFHALCRSLGLPLDVTPDTVTRFYADVRTLQADVTEAETRERAHEEDVAAVRADLLNSLDLLQDLAHEPDIDDPIEDATRMFAALERVGDHAEVAMDVASARTTVDQHRRELEEGLAAWGEAPDPETLSAEELEALTRDFLDRAEEVRDAIDECAERDSLRGQLERVFTRATITSALATYLSNSGNGGGGPGSNDDAEAVSDAVLDHVSEVVDEYGDVAAMDARLSTIGAELDGLETESDELREERAEKQNRLERLRSDEDVHAAHETIQRGRRELEPLAEEYATNRLAEYFLDELYERYIDRTTGPLLERASGIFESITNGEYRRIDTTDELTDLDFTTLLAEGNSRDPGELSRATVEQLFLAVRLARIQLVEQPLPVVLDDSFTNFDPEHRRRTLQIVGELARTNQVFLLTCHPELVDSVVGGDVDASYWQVVDGQFEGPTSSTRAKGALEPSERSNR